MQNKPVRFPTCGYHVGYARLEYAEMKHGRLKIRPKRP
jgi:hypothetical protein